MEVSSRGAHERRYWDPVYRPRRRLTQADVDDLLGTGIEQAITRRIPSEGPIGVMLGGGIDASTVAAFTRRLTGPEREIKAYSAVFPDHPTVDEST
jgi:asparagine synthetase B (glutamine-hydrolysing)